MQTPAPLGWILSSNPGYNAQLYQKTAHELGHTVRSIHPKRLSLFLDTQQASLWLDDQIVALPDYLIHEFDPNTHQHCMHLCRYMHRQGTRLLYHPDGVERIYDKNTTHRLLHQAKLASPQTLMTRMPCQSDLVAKTVGFPCLIKKTTASFGDGIFRCMDATHFDEINAWIGCSQGNDEYLIQRFLKSHAGVDYRLLVFNGRLLAATQRTATQGYKTNAHQGGTYQAIEPNDQLVDMAIEAQGISGLSLAGVDIMLDDQGHACVIEINHDPYLKIMKNPAQLATQILAYLTQKKASSSSQT